MANEKSPRIKVVKAPKNPKVEKREKARADVEAAKSNAGNAKTVEELRTEVTRLASAVELLLNEMEGQPNA